MPRDAGKVYLTVALNPDSRLMRQLEKDSQQKSVPKSHLIAVYADEYVRLFLDGETNQAPSANIWRGASQNAASRVSAMITSDISDDDLADAYGD